MLPGGSLQEGQDVLKPSVTLPEDLRGAQQPLPNTRPEETNLKLTVWNIWSSRTFARRQLFSNPFIRIEATRQPM